ncbi:MAG: 3-carboxy-cis,cis-muconate cycloisomerase [Salaquimonas sp.]|jgi:3-carboxy-cis,cis-muconate cycloisomerase|nr:3-carboxy-cis,cis-muconate cycloisomerase [Salaquimonas sp.]
MSYTPFNAPILSGLLSDREIAACFSIKVEIAAMALFEAALARATAAAGLIPADAGDAIASVCSHFEPDMAELNAATARDGVCVPELVRQIRAAVDEQHTPHVHFGATSQDVIDTALMVRMKPVVATLRERLGAIAGQIAKLEERFGDRPLMARTRMQAAQETTIARRLATWRMPIERHAVRFEEVAPRLLNLQLGGPIGTREAYGDKAGMVAGRIGTILGLSVSDQSWHSARDTIAEFASLLSLITGSLGKIGQDIALMAQNEIAEIELSGTGGSSAMAHKHNPVRAEILVTLARFNATLVSGMHHSLVHEQERSGAAWTLEWMLLPQMCIAAGASTRTALGLLGQIERIGSA